MAAGLRPDPLVELRLFPESLAAFGGHGRQHSPDSLAALCGGEGKILFVVPKVLRKETAFPLCRAMESRWNRYDVSIESSVTTIIRLPISYSTAVRCHEPAVSMATGKKM